MARHDYDRERSWRRYDDDDERWGRGGERSYDDDRGGYGRERRYGEGRGREGAYGEPVRGGYGVGREGRRREGREDWGREGRDGGRQEQYGGPYVGRGPRNYRRSDERIREDVSEILTQHGLIDASDIEVDVRDGEVTLRGTVDSRRTRRLAEDAIEDVPGVNDIHNELRAGERRAETDRVSEGERVVVSGRPEEGSGYRYGSAMAADPRYRGRNWENVEPELRTGYSEWSRREGRGREQGEDAWERLREDVRRAWDEVRR